jgi:hypothetical protein
MDIEQKNVSLPPKSKNLGVKSEKSMDFTWMIPLIFSF